MQELTPEGRHIVEDVAQRHGVSPDAALALLRALTAGHGTMAQFNHPELGGMGQWTQGGMIMIGNMFDQGLRARVDALCTELASLLRAQPTSLAAMHARSQSQNQAGAADVSLFVPEARSLAGAWWPAELGSPSFTGAQNDLRYAIFPAVRRLAIEKSGRVTLFDTGDHVISGVAQQESRGQSLTFTSQHGLVNLVDLPAVEAGRPPSASDVGAERSSLQPEPAALSQVGAPRSHAADLSSADVFVTLERVAELHRKGILTDEEFATKKAELLSRI